MSTPIRQSPTSNATGLAYGVAAYAAWGLFPLFWPLLEPADPLEITACRILFCLAVVVVILAVRHQLNGLRSIDRSTLLRLSAAGIAIAANWSIYIWGVNNGHVIETSLGYFINPLLTIGLGVVILRERLRAVQWTAVALGLIAVTVLSFDYGRPPWIALALAASFGTYGFIKKGVKVSPPEGLVIEGGVLAIPALVLLGVLAISGNATWVGHDATVGHLLLLVSAGPITALPLLLFAGAATRLPLSTMGLLQYLTPVMQFVIGVLILRETTSIALLCGFALVWIALAMLAIDGVRHRSRVPDAFAA
jgi:chloramphenicol-sensitive protein RarD